MIQPRADSTTALRQALLAAVAAGAVGDLYFVWGTASATAFAAPALIVPVIATAALLWVIARAVLALTPYDAKTLGGCVVISGIVAAVGVIDLVPPVARDELTHHLAIPILYIRARHIFEVPFADQSYYPMLIEMLYTPLLFCLPHNVPKFLHLLFGLGCGAVVALYVRRTDTSALAALGGLLVVSIPVVSALSASANVDLGLLFFATAALVALLVWSEELQPTWLILAALLAGFAAATKYNGLLVILLLGAGTILLPSAQETSMRRLRYGVIFLVFALLPLAPWLIKNYLQTGNPTFPLFNSLMHGRVVPAGEGIGVLTKRRVLYGESWLEIALIPLRIFTTGREGDPVRFDGVFNPLLLLGFAAAFGRAPSRRARFLLVYGGMYGLLAFFLATLRARYVIVIVGPLVILTVTQLRRLRALGRTGAALANVAIAGALFFSAVHFWLLWQEYDPVSYLSGRVSRDSYITRFVPEYDVLQFANAALPTSARIYLLFLGNRSYYCDRDFIYDFYYSGTMLRTCIRDDADGGGIAACLRRQGVSHLLWSDALLDKYLGYNLTDEQLGRWRDFAINYLQVLYANNGFSLYQIRAL